MTETLNSAQARRMALAAQGFTRSRPVSVSARHVHRVMDRLGVLQIDSVNVFARSHYLPLFSRLGSYDPALLDRIFLSRTTHYVEYLAHEATFIPVEDWPLWQFRMDDFRRRWSKDDSWMSVNTRTLGWVQDELRARGPLRPADLREDAPRERGTWWDWDDVKVALEHMWRTGDVAISGRRGFERTYALAEQVIPDGIRSQEISRADAIRELVRRAARSSGVATQADLADYYR
ncbi:MAG: crosslink repair DNA glycosylase YcaQ family protein, partial [Microbacterium sp.]|uniref:DNA glycosylase AlkZ-like family protein n=1 Tax=Microbacterium sp. TaxID=51671 RepID=UPI003BB0CE94